MSSVIPVPSVSRKRDHVLSKNTECNVPSAKKHSKNTRSNCRVVKKVVKKVAKTSRRAKKE